VAVSSLVYGKPPEKYSFSPTSIELCVEPPSLNFTEIFITHQNVSSTLVTVETIGTTSTR